MLCALPALFALALEEVSEDEVEVVVCAIAMKGTKHNIAMVFFIISLYRRRYRCHCRYYHYHYHRRCRG